MGETNGLECAKLYASFWAIAGWEVDGQCRRSLGRKGDTGALGWRRWVELVELEG